MKDDEKTLINIALHSGDPCARIAAVEEINDRKDITKEIEYVKRIFDL